MPGPPERERPRGAGGPRRALALGIAFAVAWWGAHSAQALPGWTQAALGLAAAWLAAEIVVGCRTRWAVPALWLGATAGHLVVLHYLRYVSAMGWLAACPVAGLWWAAWALVARVLWLRLRPGPAVVGAAAAWTVMAGAKGSMPVINLPWTSLAHTWWRVQGALDAAWVGGESIVTLLVAGAGFAMAVVPRRFVWAPAVAAAALFAGIALAVGPGDDPPARTLTVVAVQPAIPQENKVDAARDRMPPDVLIARQVRLTREALGDGPADLVCWAETMYPHLTGERPGDAGLSHMGALAREFDAWFLVGSNHLEARDEPGEHDLWNSAHLFGPDGVRRARYDKQVLVSFSEYVPGAQTFEWIADVVREQSGGYFPDMSHGRRPALVAVDGLPPMGLSICFESAFSAVTAEPARDGARLLVQLSNEAWFRESREMDHMLAACAFRAAECRLPFVRCTNSGVTSLVGRDGRVLEILEVDGRDRAVPGSLRVEVPVHAPDPGLFVRFGDVIFHASWVALLLLATLGPRRRRREGGLPAKSSPPANS